MSDPTLPELMRRLDEVSRRMEHLGRTMETSYVRRDVYEAKHDALKAEVAGKITELSGDLIDLRNARDKDQAYRRQIMAGAAVGLILLLVNLAIATSNFVSMGGAG